LKLFILSALLLVSVSAISAQPNECSGTSEDAVMQLQPPLKYWGNIYCTPYGHIIAAKEGWIWSNPGGFSPVMIPSQMVRENPEKLGNKSYFIKIDMVALDGKEAKEAIDLFETGYDKSSNPPKPYSVIIESVSGKSLKFQFFDNGNDEGGWGMWCNKKCDPSTRFMILNMSKRPNK